MLPRRAIARRPRAAVGLARAVEFARAQVAAGATVYLRDVQTRQTRQTLTLHRSSDDLVKRLIVSDPDRPTIVVAVR